MALIDFLVTYNAAVGRLDSYEEYLHADAAMRDFASLESEHRDEKDLQVVLLTADSLETLKSTHPHFFADPDAADVLTVLAEA